MEEMEIIKKVIDEAFKKGFFGMSDAEIVINAVKIVDNKLKSISDIEEGK
jgi:hypothetical protein